MMLPKPNWFKVQEMAGDLWALDDNGQDTIYLVQGKAKALLIDTGLGIGDLAQTVASLTSLPLIVVNTHGHPDHVGGDYQFENIYIAGEDISLLDSCFYGEHRNWVLEQFLKGQLEKSDMESWLARKPQKVNTIQPGDSFDLGERVIKVIAVPGHTSGCIGLLDENNRYLFTGDSVLAGTVWMHLPESLPLHLFRQSLNQLNSLADQFDKLLPGHMQTPVSNELIPKLIAGISEILSGKRKGEYHQTFLGAGLLCEFDGCGIIYNEQKL